MLRLLRRLRRILFPPPPPPPPSVPAPAGLLLGESHRGAPVELAWQDLRRHQHIIGTSGVGKSRFIAGLFTSLLNARYAGAIIDPHGDLCDTVLALLLDTG